MDDYTSMTATGTDRDGVAFDNADTHRPEPSPSLSSLARNSLARSGADSSGGGTSETDDGRDDSDRSLTDGPEWSVLLRITGPMIFGLLAVLSVGLVDAIFIGRLGTDPLAALSFAFPVTVAVTGLCIGSGVGTASVVSRRIGEGHEDEASRAAFAGVILGVGVVGIISLILALTVEPVFERLGAGEDVLPFIIDYMPAYLLSVPFLAASIILHNISRAVGEANWPTGIMAVSGALNIAVTAGLVFGLGPLPELGMLGAALGTLIARASVVWVSVWLVGRKLGMISWYLPQLDCLLPVWRRILRVAAPSAIGNVVNPLAITVVTAILASFAQEAVAGFGVARQVQSIAVIPLLALSSAMGPIAGQNWGADRPGRISKSLKIAFWASSIWAGLIAAALWFGGEWLAGLFSDDDLVAEDAVAYLRVVPLSTFGFGMAITCAAAFNGLGQSVRGLAFYLFRAVLLLMPLAFIGSLLADEVGAYAGMAVANGVGGLLIAVYALRWLKAHGNEAGEEGAGEEGAREEDATA